MLDFLLTHTPLLYLVQSLWRDEAFSILVAERPLSFIATRLGFEPPVYYALLHVWIRLFGQSEIAARSLSLLGLVLATVIIIRWAAKEFKNHWLAFFTPVFFFLNPMLLYYAFEVRTYGWYIFFTTLSLYAYTNRKWTWFIISSLLGFYTHTYFLFYLVPVGLHWLIYERKHIKLSRQIFIRHPDARAFGIIALGALPWIIKIIHESSRLKSSWYFPVDIQLVYSVLGNMFIGYEGTPWYGWRYTQYLSYILIGFGLVALRDIRHLKRNVLFVLMSTVPLIITVGISFIKPLFVNRYLIPVTIAEILVIVVAIYSIKNTWVQKFAAAICLLFVLWVNWWYPPQHPKLPIRDTVTQVNSLLGEDDIMLAESSLIFLETRYYAKDRSRVFLYNPNNGVFPWYVGDAVVTAKDMARDYPTYPSRAFLIHENGTVDIVYHLPATQKSRLGKN